MSVNAAGQNGTSPTAGDRQVHRTACCLCEAICGIEVTTVGDQVVDIRGDAADPLSRGHVCPKSVVMADVYNDPDRLRRPVRRRGDQWEELEWEEAIDLVARRLAETRRRHGGNAVGVYLGNPIVHSLGNLTHGFPFTSLLGTDNLFSAASVDQQPQHVASTLLYGHPLLLPKPDLDRTTYLLAFGANPIASNGSLMTAPDVGRRLREIQERGGKVVVLDPRRTETAEVADEHVFIRPVTDAAVLLAMLNVVLTERPRRLPAYVSGVDDVRRAIAGFTPEVASRFSGVPSETITRLALEFADAESAACYGRIGVSTQRFGTLCHWAIQTLNIVTGNLDREGGPMFPEPAVSLMKNWSKEKLGARHSRVRGLPSVGDEFPVAVLTEEMTTPGEGQIRAMVTISGNPVLSTPGGAMLDKAMEDLDFMVSVDLYINETTRHADVILPPVSALQREQYDIAFRMLAIRNTAKYSEAALPKPPGERDDWEIFRDLGRAYRRHMAGSFSSYVRQFSLRDTITAGLLRVTPRRLVDVGLRTGPYRLSVRKLLANPSGVDLGPMRPGLLPDRLLTEDKRIDLLPAAIAGEFARLRADIDSAPDDGLRLVGRRHVRGNNSWGHNFGRLVTGESRHHLLMHPDDAARCGVANGPATLRSRIGAIRVDVQQTMDIMAGTVSLPHGFGHARRGTRLSVANHVPGASINDITDPLMVDELSGNAAFCGLPVTVEPIAVDETVATGEPQVAAGEQLPVAVD